MSGPLHFYEFFAGGGMARTGLGSNWNCLFANDFDPIKGEAYRANFGATHFSSADVWSLTTKHLPGRPDLVWASSPCQDFSLAGGRAGLAGGRSSALLGFWRLMEALAEEGRGPRALVIENVTGLLTARGGADFIALSERLASAGYRFGALEIDAAAFLPQSRPRVFMVATQEPPPPGLSLAGPGEPFHTAAIRRAQALLPDAVARCWLWWSLPLPPVRNTALGQVLEPDAPWSPPARTAELVSLMNPLHRARLEAEGDRVGAAFRRIRLEHGVRVQRAEARFDGLAGCLRTPTGGSSRQFVLRKGSEGVQSRLMTPREGARLMGLPDDYRLPPGSTAAWKVVGDGVAAPVVRWLAEHLLEPLCHRREAAAA
jgi:DNA (cytosine-5)-methyltransferase 1